MTKLKAKSLSLEVWRYFVEHPEMEIKENLPGELYSKIKFLHNRCPLCELFHVLGSVSCPGCPLSGRSCSCNSKGQSYNRWRVAKTPEKRREAAEEIVRRVEAWEVEA
jgi:uncharacterized Zn finger protein (UPF0148 family)